MVNLESILSGINAKNERCWEQLYTSCYAAMCVYVESIVKDMDCSKDIVQDLLVNLWHSDIRFASGRGIDGVLDINLCIIILYYISVTSKEGDDS